MAGQGRGKVRYLTMRRGGCEVEHLGALLIDSTLSPSENLPTVRIFS